VPAQRGEIDLFYLVGLPSPRGWNAKFFSHTFLFFDSFLCPVFSLQVIPIGYVSSSFSSASHGALTPFFLVPLFPLLSFFFFRSALLKRRRDAFRLFPSSSYNRETTLSPLSLRFCPIFSLLPFPPSSPLPPEAPPPLSARILRFSPDFPRLVKRGLFCPRLSALANRNEAFLLFSHRRVTPPFSSPNVF